jgi:type IV pilus assembly protein PilA
MRKAHLAKGFSLIEALAVVAIIGILSAFAIPSYLDYLAKTRVSEMFSLARPAQLGVANAFYGGVPLEDIDSREAGVTWSNHQHEAINAILVEGGRVVMQGNAQKLTIPGAEKDEQLIVRLAPKEANGMIHWQCHYENEKYKKFLPKHCEQSN